MFKNLIVFSFCFFLTACAGNTIRQAPLASKNLKQVDFFEQGHTQAAFKVIGQMNDAYLEGVLRIKKIGEQDFDVVVMTGGSYRVLQAVVSAEGVAYRYLFKDADTSLIRGRIDQFLRLLLLKPKAYRSLRNKKGEITLTFDGYDEKLRYSYKEGELYPHSASSVKALNTSDISYSEYTPLGMEDNTQVPHQIIYKDGGITLDLTLISLR